MTHTRILLLALIAVLCGWGIREAQYARYRAEVHAYLTDVATRQKELNVRLRETLRLACAMNKAAGIALSDACRTALEETPI